MQNENLRKKFPRFRILVIGRANAGKTTILKRICDSTENPEIYNEQGEKVCILFWFQSSRALTICDQVDRAQIEESLEVSVLNCHHRSCIRVQLMCPKRGAHDIEDGMVFQCNPDFVFHDSQGFAAGSIKEFDQMKSFVGERARTTFLEKRIHAIW